MAKRTKTRHTWQQKQMEEAFKYTMSAASMLQEAGGDPDALDADLVLDDLRAAIRFIERFQGEEL